MKHCESCPSRHSGVFCDLNKDALNDVSKHKVLNHYKKGQTIFFQGNPPMGLYCVSKGKIKITRTGNDGKEAILRIAGPGDVLGHRSLFSKEKYEATATVLEDSSICFIEKNFIYNALEKNPSIAMAMIEKLSRDMGVAERKSAAMFQKNARERLADLFIEFAEDYGVKVDGKIKLDIRLSRDEIASIIGSAHETVIRLISEFKEEGILELDGKTIFVQDMNKLREFANYNDQ
jgi:CRP-like cAMP-binding protein